MTTGEGGMLTTDDDEIAEKASLIRVHGESWGRGDAMLKTYMYREAHLHEMLGWAFRMPEMAAALGSVQLKRLNDFVSKRIENAQYLTNKLKKIDGLTPPVVKKNCRHAFYKYIMKFDPNTFKVPLDDFIDALNAEGIPCDKRYPNPPSRQPLFKNKVGYGKTKCPFDCPWYTKDLKNIEYKEGDFPNAECADKVLFKLPMNPELTKEDLDDIIHGVEKVAETYRK
jgi:perosamine synthetase